MKDSFRFLRQLLLCVVIGLAAACAAVMILGGGGKSLRLVTEDQYSIIERYSRLDQVYTTLMEDYYTEPDSDSLVLGAIRGMMSSLDDPYTFYYTTEEMQATQADDEGRFHGIGIVIQQSDSAVKVIRVYEGSPAASAGMLAGDVITGVDGSAVDSVAAATELIVGEDGTEVIVTVRRGEETLDLSCVRAEVVASHVTCRVLDDGIGYVCISQFSGDDVTGLQSAIAELQEAGVRGLVLDLRNDPGGYLDHCVAVADELLPEGLVCYTLDREGSREEQHVDSDYWDIPMVVLVNGGSASASELFTGAFQDDGRGLVVGTTTYGKGIVQNVITFGSDGAGMQYTSSTYYTPLGRSLHKTGITPDIVVELTGTDTSVGEPDPSIDDQLAAAIEALEGLISP